MNTYRIIDGHQDISFNSLHITGKDFLAKNSFDESHLLSAPRLNQSDYVRLTESGVKVVFGVCFPYKFDGKSIISSTEICREEMARQLDYYNELETKSAGKMKIIRTKTDLETVLDTDGMLGLVLLAEDAVGISLDNIEGFYAKGLRMIGPVWNRDNQYGGGTDTDNGITEDGKKLLIKMEELGIMLDTAHMNKTLFSDAMQCFNGKVFNSHTCTLALNPHRRNLDDSQLKEVANRGGVLGVAFVPEFLNKRVEDATLADVVAHIKHAVEVCGVDHVAFGSDFDGMSWPQYVPEIKDTSEYINLIKELEKIYSAEEVEKIIFSNWKKFLLSALA
ncbi:MAG: dipeptidase [Candidatus Paceibacteria bacterium]